MPVLLLMSSLWLLNPSPGMFSRTLINSLEQFEIGEKSEQFVVDHWGSTGKPAYGRVRNCVGCPINLITTTDKDYRVDGVTVDTNGYFKFSYYSPGVHRIELIDHDGQAHVNSNISGRLRSYANPSMAFINDRLWLYDLAVAIIAGTNVLDDDRVSKWVELLLQTATNDEFPFFINGRSGEMIDEYYRTGSQFWCLYALAWYQLHHHDNPHRDQIRERLFITSVRIVRKYYDEAVGLFKGGSGRYVSNYRKFHEHHYIQWHSTEHNIDAFFTLRIIHRVLGINDFQWVIDKLGAALLGLWDGSRGIALQGLGDTSEALDCASWYSLFCRAVNRPDLQHKSLAALNRFRNKLGYYPYFGGYDYADRYICWTEGLAGVILARRYANDIAQKEPFIRDITLLQGAYDDGLKYVIRRDSPRLEMYSWNSLGSTAWALLALNPNGFWETDTTKLEN